jgi:hypothetical protein
MECFNAGRPLLCMLNRVQHTRSICVHLHNSHRQECSQLLGDMIMWSSGRDQHMKVSHRECFSMISSDKS